MKDVIDKATVHALEYNADGSSQTFFAKLKAGEFQSTRCGSCGKVSRPRTGDCCVFCSYGDVKCPSMQEADKELTQ